MAADPQTGKAGTAPLIMTAHGLLMGDLHALFITSQYKRFRAFTVLPQLYTPTLLLFHHPLKLLIHPVGGPRHFLLLCQLYVQ